MKKNQRKLNIPEKKKKIEKTKKSFGDYIEAGFTFLTASVASIIIGCKSPQIDENIYSGISTNIEISGNIERIEDNFAEIYNNSVGILKLINEKNNEENNEEVKSELERLANKVGDIQKLDINHTKYSDFTEMTEPLMRIALAKTGYMISENDFKEAKKYVSLANALSEHLPESKKYKNPANLDETITLVKLGEHIYNTIKGIELFGKPNVSDARRLDLAGLVINNVKTEKDTSYNNIPLFKHLIGIYKNEQEKWEKKSPEGKELEILKLKDAAKEILRGSLLDDLRESDLSKLNKNILKNTLDSIQRPEELAEFSYLEPGVFYKTFDELCAVMINHERAGERFTKEEATKYAADIRKLIPEVITTYIDQMIMNAKTNNKTKISNYLKPTNEEDANKMKFLLETALASYLLDEFENFNEKTEEQKYKHSIISEKDIKQGLAQLPRYIGKTSYTKKSSPSGKIELN
jgi:hypothetical protein